MALSQATLVQRVRWELGDKRVWQTTGTAADASDATIDVPDGTDWTEGDIGEWVSDGDAFLVQSVASNTLTVVRSFDGSTGAAHAGTALTKNPRYRFHEITNAIESVIQGSLPFPKVYKKVAGTITPDSTKVWYDLAAAALALIDVRQLYGTNDTKEGRYGDRHSARPVVLRRNMTTSLVTSGVGVRFPAGLYHASNTINVDYAAKITDTVSSNNYSDLTDGDAIVEAIIYGAVSHLEAALENRKPRKPRQDRETLRGAALYDRKFEEALNRAQQELRASAPLMRNWSTGVQVR